MPTTMDERTIQRLKPKTVQPERVARMYERLREGVPSYTFSDEVTPFHSSYDDWHFFGKRKPKTSSKSLDLKSPARTSRPNSTRTHSDYSQSDTAHFADPGSDGEKEKDVYVIARVSKHALRLEREYKQAVALRKLSEEDNVHFVKPMHFYRLPAKQPGDKPLAVSIIEAPGRNYLFDIVEFGPNFYKATSPAELGSDRNKQTPLLTFLDFAIGASECCEILHHGHEMVHGELRGDAFHFNKDTGNVRLINFGSGARSFEHGLTSAGWSSLTAQRGVEHKLQFIAPEQTGRLPAEPDSRTDIYSLGILFWTMLTGLPAFAGNTPLEIMQNVLSRRMPTATSIRPDVPDALSAIVQKMTHKSMDDRYNSASGVKHDLQTLKKILTDGDTKALDDFKIASNDVSCFFKLPTHLVGREKQRQTIVDAIEQAAKRFARTQPLSKKGLINLSSGTSFTSSDRLDSMVLDDLLSDSASSGTKGESRLNSVSDLTPVSSRQKYSSSNESVPAPRAQGAQAESTLSPPPGSRDSGTRP
jgi:serine/threonine protein kinase